MLYFLIGYMGSGKSSLAKRVSRLTRIPYIDSDKAIEAKTGMSVSSIFELHGESYFRELEHEFILSLDDARDLIISTGGGLPCFNDNISLLNKKGTTFYLKLSPDKLSERLINSKTERPLLKGKSEEELLQFLTGHLAEREMYYLQSRYLIDANKPFDTISLLLSGFVKAEK